MSDPSAPNRPELLERLKLAYTEYRAEVTLGWERQKFFLTLNPSLTALVSLGGSDRYPEVARIALIAAAIVAFAGALVVHRSHRRYQATRATLQSLENELGIADLQTTGGQRAARGGINHEWFKVVNVVTFVLLVLGCADVWLVASSAFKR